MIRTLQKELERLGVKIYLNTPVKELLLDGECCTGVVLMNGRRENADAVIVATGGISYPSTGSTGDGLPHGRTGRTEGDGNFPGIGSF